MSDVAYAQDLMREAWPVARHGSVKAALYEAHRYISRRVQKEFTPRRARAIWEGSARRIDSEEADALRAAIIEEARHEQKALRARLAKLDARLTAVDKDFSGEALAAIREQASRLGGVSGAGDRRR